MSIFLGNQRIGLASLGSIPVSSIFIKSYVDGDAEAFINATGITGSAALAVNTLVVSLKSENLWNSFDAIYPMVGANENSHKYNLKNPQNTDAAFRLNFQGGWTHNSDGAKPNGTNAYANTFYALSTNLSTTNGCMSYYSFTNSAAAAMAEIGSYGAANSDCFIQIRYSGDRFYPNWGNGDSVSNLNSQGYYIVNESTTAAAVNGYKNGTLVVGGSASSAISTGSAYLGAANDTRGLDFRYSDRGCSFATLGDSIAAASIPTLSTIVNTFQSNLGRYSY